MGRISALTELTSLASDDYLVVLDSSANIAKKITIANAFGIADFGWTATGESWTYASWTSGTRTGTITVPTDATTKYKAGDRIKITQSTGGTKYGIITKVAATLLTVFFPSGTTLNNEAITSPFYALAGVNPLGFPTDSTLWYLEVTNTSLVGQASPTTNTWYNIGSISLVVPIGIWDLSYQVGMYSSGGTAKKHQTTLSTANNTESTSRNTKSFESSTTLADISSSFTFIDQVNLASSTTYYLNGRTQVTSTQLYFLGDRNITIVRAECALL